MLKICMRCIKNGTVFNHFYATHNFSLKYDVKYAHLSAPEWYFSSNRLCRKSQGGHPIMSRYPHPKFFVSDRVDVFVKNLKKNEREKLLTELQKYSSAANSNGTLSNNGTASVTNEQLKLLFMFNCAPFIGFGFLDNAIMIVAGEYIDMTIGVTLGITTMAAAALGNLVSDLAGIGLAGYVEVLCSKMGLPVPDLSSQQLELTKSRVSANLGKAVGIVIGCLIGMFPLLLKSEKNEVEENRETEV